MIEYKGYRIVSDGTFGYDEIKPMAQGQIPAPLRGMYKGQDQAKIAIDQYEALNKKGVKKNVKAECTV